MIRMLQVCILTLAVGIAGSFSAGLSAENTPDHGLVDSQSVLLAAVKDPNLGAPRGKKPPGGGGAPPEDFDELKDPDFSGDALKSCNQPCFNQVIKGVKLELISAKTMQLDPKYAGGDEVVISGSKKALANPLNKREVRRAFLKEKRKVKKSYEEIKGPCVVAEADKNQTVLKKLENKLGQDMGNQYFAKDCECEIPDPYTSVEEKTSDKTYTMSVYFWEEVGFAYHRGNPREVDPSKLTDPMSGKTYEMPPNTELGRPEYNRLRKVWTVPVRTRHLAILTVKATYKHHKAKGVCTTTYTSIPWSELASYGLPQPDDQGEPIAYGTPDASYTFTPDDLTAWQIAAKQTPVDETTGQPLDGNVIIIPKETEGQPQGDAIVVDDRSEIPALQPGDKIVVVGKCHQSKTYVIGQDPPPEKLALAGKPLSFVTAHGDEQAVNNIVNDLTASGITVNRGSIAYRRVGDYDQVTINRYSRNDATDCPKLPLCCGGDTSGGPKKGEPGWYEPGKPRHGQ